MATPRIVCSTLHNVRGRLAAAAVLALALAPVPGFAADYSVRCLTEPIGDVYVSTPEKGILARINCSEGMFVEAGFVVIDLENKPEELEVQRRQFFVENLKTELSRSELLQEKGASIAAEEVDKKRSEFQIASAELALAREALARRKIEAPIAGVITDIPLKVGEFCEEGKVLFRIVDTRKFYANASIDPIEGAKLKVGDAIRLEVDTGASKESLTGHVIFASPVVDQASGLMRIRAVFENPAGTVRPGVSGQLYLKP